MQEEIHFDSEIAIIGMSCRFPDAPDKNQFWQNLKNGLGSIVPVEKGKEDGILDNIDYMSYPSIRKMLSDPNYVRRGSLLKGVDLFDASFFGLNPGEVEVMDPQQRLFLECSWEAVEDAGYDTERFPGLVGVYAGCGISKYLLSNLFAHVDLIYSERDFLIVTGNENDYLSTRVSYKLDLKGPSFTVQSACSTSLVATHVACQSLLSGECDMALAGGAHVIIPHNAGYLHRPGGILSATGNCYAFDGRADGTVFAHGGVGVIVLKRLDEAIRDGDNIYSIIKGSCVNNDGSVKAGYVAPGVNGQTAVVKEALSLANVDPETIQYVETHGTGTALGDPLEVTALTQAFRSRTDKKSFCAIGTVKSNIGHAAVAAGVAGLIKTTMALKNQAIPASLNFEDANPLIDFGNSPFFVNTKLREWKKGETPRRAGVSAFGVGGTNAHVILEEAPAKQAAPESPLPWKILVLSAKTTTALDKMTQDLAEYLQKENASLSDTAFTLGIGRRQWEQRRFILCQNKEDALNAIQSKDTKKMVSMAEDKKNRPVVFMFSGQGSQYVNMGLELYKEIPLFRETVDHCCKILKPDLGLDLKEILYPSPEKEEEAKDKILQTSFTQPSLFVLEYAVAKLWMQWGIVPESMIGHSIGEYVAACLSGVFSLESALHLVAVRGKLMQAMLPGEMLAVPLDAKELEPLLKPGLSLAAHNAPSRCVVAGDAQAIASFEAEQEAKGVACRRLFTSHAFHSEMMQPMLDSFIKEVKKIQLHEPQIPYISNLTGKWITKEDVQDPNYWAKHLRNTVRFSDGIVELMKESKRVFLEVGPGQTLVTLSKAHGKGKAKLSPLASVRGPQDQGSDCFFFMTNLGKLWASGAKIEWKKFYEQEKRSRVSLPTYPFERQRHWIDPKKQAPGGQSFLGKNPNITDWFYSPSWKRSSLSLELQQEENLASKEYWIFGDSCGLGESIARKLKEKGQKVVMIFPGEKMQQTDLDTYSLVPGEAKDYIALFQERKTLPDSILHLWSVSPSSCGLPGSDLDRSQNLGFYSLLFLAQALGEQNIQQTLPIFVVSHQIHEVNRNDMLCPEKATILGPCKGISLEYPNLSCRNIDIVLTSEAHSKEQATEQILQELFASSKDRIIAYRDQYRWVQTFEALPLSSESKGTRLRKEGVYVITGGMGGVGLVLAEYLAKVFHARLALVGRSKLPHRNEWQSWLETHPANDATSTKIQKLLSLEQEGAKVLTLSADVTNLEEMQKAIQEASQAFGTIHGVIHAAGIPGGGMMQLKKKEAAQAVLTPKVQGTLVLAKALQGYELDFLLLASSIFSVTGGLGQVDYCAANSFLDAFAHQHTKSTGQRTISLNWDGWEEVGMTKGSQIMGKSKDSLASQQIGHPLLQECTEEKDGQIVYTTYFSLSEQWVLSDHIMMGSPVIPGTAFLEMAYTAAKQHAHGKTVEIRDVFFMTPLVVGRTERKEVKLVLAKNEEGFAFSIETQFRDPKTGKMSPLKHAIGEISYSTPKSPAAYDIPSLIQECSSVAIVDVAGKEEAPKKGEPLEFGPRWKNLRKVYIAKDKALAELELPEKFLSDLEQFTLHPAMLDMGNGVVFGHISSSQQHACAFFGGDESIFLPLNYKTLVVRERFPKKIYSYIRFKPGQFEEDSPEREIVTYNITMMDEYGKTLVEVDEFSLKKVKNEGVLAEKPQFAQSQEVDFIVDDKPLLQAVNLRTDAIMPQEGVETFRRVMSHRVPSQVVATARDLVTLLKPENLSGKMPGMESSPQTESKSVLPRPNIQTPYKAPETDLQKNLVEIWQKVLGISQIGIHDNFFELGGDSILGVQIIAKAKRVGIDLNANQLFQHHTIAELANVLTKPKEEVAKVATAPSKPAEPEISEDALKSFINKITEA